MVELFGEEEPSYILKGLHPVVVLNDSSFRRATVSVAPISSLYAEDGRKKNLILTDLELPLERYTGILNKDSFVKADQIRPVSRNKLGKYLGRLHKKDLRSLDIRIIVDKGAMDTVEALIQATVEEILEKLNEESE